jgi:protease-4
MHERRPASPLRRAVLASLVAAVALAALPAGAQVQRIGAPIPGGLPLPGAGAAVAEEATSTTVNPAGIGFVHGPSFEYFHVEGHGPNSADGDGLFAAGLTGPLGSALSMEWVRPEGGARYRLTTLGLALSDGHAASFGIAWRWWDSPDRAIEPMHAFDLGLTLRPWRHLSLGASAIGIDSRYQGQRLPIQYDVGLGFRFLGDAVTFSADVLANDQVRGRFDVTGVALGVAIELEQGFALTAQYRIPVRSTVLAPPQELAAGTISLAWNGPHAGAMVGATGARDDSRWLVGVRASRERYPSSPRASEAPRVDLAAELTPRRFLFLDVPGRDPFGDLLRRLSEAGDDAAVGAVVLEIGELPVSAGRIEELRAAVFRLRDRKPVLAYLTGGGLKSYWLASAATAVAMSPPSTLLVNGLATSQYYLKDGLARLGVAVEVARVGGYKTAPEPFTRNDPTPESQEMIGAILDDIYDRVVGDVARGRKLDPAAVKGLLDRGIFSAATARDERLVDVLLWPDELEGWTRKATGRSLDIDDGYAPAPVRQARHWGRSPVIAVIGLEGIITEGHSRREPLGTGRLSGAENVIDQLEAAARSSEVKAIVLRIDSPGGDAVASDLIWRAVKKAREKKPVIASMGDLAASGGYLVAVGAERIVAEPSTLTGSIGVFVLKPELSGVLEKLAIHRHVQARGKNADISSLAHPWTAEERALVEQQVEVVYGTFLDRVVEGRALPRAEVEKVAGGRVWTGQQALSRKLVDQLGGLDDAVAVARERAGLAKDAVVEVRRFGGGWSDFQPSAAVAAWSGDEQLLRRAAALFPELRTAALLLELGPVLALPVEWIDPPGP